MNGQHAGHEPACNPMRPARMIVIFKDMLKIVPVRHFHFESSRNVGESPANAKSSAWDSGQIRMKGSRAITLNRSGRSGELAARKAYNPPRSSKASGLASCATQSVAARPNPILAGYGERGYRRSIQRSTTSNPLKPQRDQTNRGPRAEQRRTPHTTPGQAHPAPAGWPSIPGQYPRGGVGK